MAVKPIPDGYRTVTPYLVIRGAAKAIEFYQKAFGAKECFRMPGPGGVIWHAEIQIGDSMVMLGDENPSMGIKSPETLGGSPFSMFLYVADVDAAFQRAVDAGCTVQQTPVDMFWGDRFCKIVDPFGHQWGMATHKEDVSPEEVGRRAAEAMKAQQ